MSSSRSVVPVLDVFCCFGVRVMQMYTFWHDLLIDLAKCVASCIGSLSLSVAMKKSVGLLLLVSIVAEKTMLFAESAFLNVVLARCNGSADGAEWKCGFGLVNGGYGGIDWGKGGVLLNGQNSCVHGACIWELSSRSFSVCPSRDVYTYVLLQ